MNPTKRLVQLAFVGVVIATLSSGQLCIAKANEAPKASFYLKRGFERALQGDNRGAEAEYRTVLKFEPNNPTAIFNHANALFRLGDYRRGIKEYNRAIKIDERNSLAFVGRGCAKAKLGDAYSAIEDFDQAIRLDQHNWIAYLDRSVAKSKLPENRDFYQDYEKALELDANIAHYFFNLPETNAMKKNRPLYDTTNPAPLSFSPTSLKPSEFEKVRQIADDPKLFSTKYDAFRRFPELYVPDSIPIGLSPLEVEMVPRELQILANSNLFADGVSGLMLPIGAKHELLWPFSAQ